MQKAAKAQGVLVYAISQIQTVPMTQPGPWGDISGGICIGLVSAWMAAIYQGKDFPYANQECTSPPYQSVHAQNVDDQTPTDSTLDDWGVVMPLFSCSVSALRALLP